MIIGFLVAKILGFLVSWFLGFLVSKFQRFTKKHMSCFLDDIDLISKIFKVYQTDRRDFSAPVFSIVVRIVVFKTLKFIKSYFSK